MKNNPEEGCYCVAGHLYTNEERWHLQNYRWRKNMKKLPCLLWILWAAFIVCTCTNNFWSYVRHHIGQETERHGEFVGSGTNSSDIFKKFKLGGDHLESIHWKRVASNGWRCGKNWYWLFDENTNVFPSWIANFAERKPKNTKFRTTKRTLKSWVLMPIMKLDEKST